MLLAEKITSYQNVEMVQNEYNAHVIDFIQIDEYGFNQLVARYNFINKEGYIRLLNGKEKVYKRLSSIMNVIFADNPSFSYYQSTIDSAKAAAQQLEIEDKQRFTTEEESNGQESNGINEESNESQNEPTVQNETFNVYNNTFNTYSEAFNYALNNDIPVVMILSSLNTTMTTERLQQLEYEYTFSKRNMNYDNMKEYYYYLESLPISSDKDDRYYKLKSWIQSYENRQKSIQENENRQRELALQANELLNNMISRGLEIKETGDSGIHFTDYYYKGEKVYSWLSGISTEEYYNGIKKVYDQYFTNQ